MTNEYADAPIELKYAPSKCIHFCLGECCLQGINNCKSDYPECIYSEPKERIGND